ncbi:MAG: rod shape-determining protein MreC [Solirubrobacterales bacterium]|nr:rod shape-determining protein MreC [Solirubrobacterales bacterium]
MHDKQVRRRRLVLLVLVVVSLVLLTDYFGESADSPLHSVQRGIVAVLSPVQEGASRVLAPVRDVANWVSGTLRAKTQRDQLQREVNALNARVAQLASQRIQNAQLTRELGLDQSIGAATYHPIGAAVISRDPSLWYQQVEVDRGSDDGVALNDPVLADGGLVGDVTTLNGSSAVVTLITDHSWAAAAEVLAGSGESGLLEPAVGSPNRMVLSELPSGASISVGQQVVTAGFTDPNHAGQGSLYPPGIPIGKVSDASQNGLVNQQQVKVAPLADLRRFESVQILTKPYAGQERAQAP